MRIVRCPVQRLSLSRRPAFSLVESTIAVVLLMVAMSTTVRALAWITRDRQALDRRAVALREADNLLDRLTTDPSAAPKLSPEGRQALPEGSVKVSRVDSTGDGLPLEQITVTVRFEDRPGQPSAPIQLTTWVASANPAPDDANGETSP